MTQSRLLQMASSTRGMASASVADSTSAHVVIPFTMIDVRFGG
jgi:hypothetical protein